MLHHEIIFPQGPQKDGNGVLGRGVYDTTNKDGSSQNWDHVTACSTCQWPWAANVPSKAAERNIQ